MAGIQQVSFTSPYAAEEADIERRRRMAELLQAKGQEGVGGTEMIGGWAIQKSPWEGIGKAAQQVSGAYQQKQADERAKQLRDRMQGDVNTDRAALLAAMQGKPAQPADVNDPGLSPTSLGAVGAPAQAPNPKAIGTMDFRSPMFQQMQMQQLLAQMNQQPKWEKADLRQPDRG